MNSLGMSSEKIIFWASGGFLEFLLANSLQKKIDSEFYVIYDVTDRPKPFYEKQKLYKKFFSLLSIFNYRNSRNHSSTIKFILLQTSTVTEKFIIFFECVMFGY